MSGIITAERLRELLHYDPWTGVFTWRVRTSNYVKVGDVAGCVSVDGYISIKIDGYSYRAHRLAWLYMTGRWPADGIDHINMDRVDNRIANLREATKSQNRMNSYLSANSSSGFKGVTWDKRECKWRAVLVIGRKQKHLGYFASPERAFIEYCFAGWRHFGDFFSPDADYIDADYIRVVRKHKERKALERRMLWNLANPDPNYMAA
jgi:hypothetical protein